MPNDSNKSHPYKRRGMNSIFADLSALTMDIGPRPQKGNGKQPRQDKPFIRGPVLVELQLAACNAGLRAIKVYTILLHLRGMRGQTFKLTSVECERWGITPHAKY